MAAGDFRWIQLLAASQRCTPSPVIYRSVGKTRMDGVGIVFEFDTGPPRPEANVCKHQTNVCRTLVWRFVRFQTVV